MKNLLYVDTPGACRGVGLLCLRLVVGAAFILHGWPKIQSPLAWMGPDAPVPGPLQACAAVAEFGGGMALMVGLLTPLAALGLAITMLVAIGMVHLPQGHAFVAKPPNPSYELAAAYLSAVVAILCLGPGRFSLDALVLGRTAGQHQPAEGEVPRKRP
jgi:putative oxidoreductase